MKAFLMNKEHDFDMQRQLPLNEQALIQDLELNTLFGAMALGDKLLFGVAKKAVLFGLHNDLETIHYRQNILMDCLRNSAIVREMYALAVESIEGEKRHYWVLSSKYPSGILYESRETLHMFVGMLKKLKNITDEHADKFESEGFTTLFSMLKKELSDEYFTIIQNHLIDLKFRNGVLSSAELGKGNKGVNYILRKPQDKKVGWLERIFAKKPSEYTFTVHERDENGARALSELKDMGINLVANALAQSTDHILSFFTMLRTELAFYVGCLNLHEQLARMGEPISFPLPVASSERRHAFKELYDVCLALTVKQKIVGNDMNVDNKELVIITGANQGGKSIFLRSICLSQ